ncbi:MAG: urea carboxylase-associated family protein [Candidatus Rokubacteria bacterium]|nr:urea carboxylase-associated family protein [Candidatus Rokubacteria bacterium]
MEMRVINELVIPAREGRAVEVKKGNILRLHIVEAPQVGDCVFFNAHDHKEMFHVGQSWALNQFLGTGNGRSFKYFFSKPPRENIMLTVVADTTRNHWGNMGGRCSRRMLELRDKVVSGHRSCQENLAEALAPYGITGDDVIDVFNVFMNVEQDGDGNFRIHPSAAKAGDYIDLRAEMDILAGISACPADATPTNGFRPKPLGVKILTGGP